MRIVFVHGINNQGRTADQIREAWLGALCAGLAPAEQALVRHAEIVVPYYGDTLLDAIKRSVPAGEEPVPLSAAEVPGDEAAFYLEVLKEAAATAGLRDIEIQAHVEREEPGELGLPHKRWLNWLARWFESASPWKGKLIMEHFLPQAFAYLCRPHVTRQIDAIVEPAFVQQPCLIVAHSLGTVITYRLLRKRLGDIPLFLTLGSPLALKAVKNRLGPPFERPGCVASWLNGLDPRDAVTLGRALTAETFAPAIENIADINNGDDPHSIEHYLADRRVDAAIVRHLDAPS